MTNGSSNFFFCSLRFWNPELKLTGRRHEILKTTQLVIGGVYVLHLRGRTSKLNFALGI